VLTVNVENRVHAVGPRRQEPPFVRQGRRTRSARSDRTVERPQAFGKGSLTRGDAAVLRFLAAAEILETDLWQQYNELRGTQDHELPAGSGNKAFTAALKNLDGDIDQCVHDNTEDEFTHFTFIDPYLKSRGAEPVNLDQFRTLPGGAATGSANRMRLTSPIELRAHDVACEGVTV
jgi:hypothetical protein